MSLPPGRWPVVLTFAVVAGLIALPGSVRADGDAGNPDAVDASELDAGFKAIAMLQDLKLAYDRRLADCRTATGDDRLCNCINSRLTLDLTYSDYLALGTGEETVTVEAAKRAHTSEARQVRAACTGSP